MAKLTCDYNFAASKNLLGGISEEDLQAYKKKAALGYERLQSMVDDGKVGFPHLPKYNTAELKEFAKDVKTNFNDLIVVGIGGSALGIEAVVNAVLPYGYNAMSYTDRGCLPRVWVADNVDPSKIQSILKICAPEDTLAVVISKSGNTVETAENYSLIHEWFKSKVQDLKKHIVVVTDPNKGPLREYANKNNLKSQKHQLNILNNRLICNIGQIHLNLIIRRSIVFAVNLCVTRKSRLYLESESKFRHSLFIFLKNFGTFRARSHHRHISA